MHRAAIRGPRGQVAPLGAAGAPASTSSPPTPDPVFFLSRTRALNPLISSNCAGGEASSWSWPECYLLLAPVTAAVTRKPLFLYGFRWVLPCYRLNGASDVREGAHARAPLFIILYGNIGNNRHYLYRSVPYSLLSPLPAPRRIGNTVTPASAVAGATSWANKIEGGYWAAASEGSDLHRIGGGARRNFRGRSRLAGELELVCGGRGLAGGGRIRLQGRNGGFPPFSAARSGAVGTAALERCAQAVAITRLSRAPHKLCQQARQRSSPRSPRRGGTPPNAISRSHSLPALDVGRIWIGLQRDRSGEAGESPQNFGARQGLGVSGHRIAGFPDREGAAGIDNRRFRVGDGSSSGSGWQSELRAKLAWEAGHVNG